MRFSHVTAANDVLSDPQALAARYAHDGCLLVRNVLDPAQTQALLEQAATMLRGWDMTTSTPHHGDLRWTGTPLGGHDLIDLDTIPALTTLIEELNTPTQPLRGVIDRICGHPMHLWHGARLFTTIPDDPAHVTRAHRDEYTLSATGDYRRMWIAITHIPFADNGLAVALGSHRTGRLPRQREAPDLTQRRTPDEPAPTKPVQPAFHDDWHTAELHPGDALIMHSELLHRGLPATSNRIRIALAIIASGLTDPRPPATFTAPECRTRNQRMRPLATLLDLTEDQHITIRKNLLITGQPVTETTVRSALAGTNVLHDHEEPRFRADSP